MTPTSQLELLDDRTPLSVDLQLYRRRFCLVDAGRPYERGRCSDERTYQFVNALVRSFLPHYTMITLNHIK